MENAAFIVLPNLQSASLCISPARRKHRFGADHCGLSGRFASEFVTALHYSNVKSRIRSKMAAFDRLSPSSKALLSTKRSLTGSSHKLPVRLRTLARVCERLVRLTNLKTSDLFKNIRRYADLVVAGWTLQKPACSIRLLRLVQNGMYRTGTLRLIQKMPPPAQWASSLHHFRLVLSFQ